jgi:hypothetical protein
MRLLSILSCALVSATLAGAQTSPSRSIPPRPSGPPISGNTTVSGPHKVSGPHTAASPPKEAPPAQASSSPKPGSPQDSKGDAAATYIRKTYYRITDGLKDLDRAVASSEVAVDVKQSFAAIKHAAVQLLEVVQDANKNIRPLPQVPAPQVMAIVGQASEAAAILSNVFDYFSQKKELLLQASLGPVIAEDMGRHRRAVNELNELVITKIPLGETSAIQQMRAIDGQVSKALDSTAEAFAPKSKGS